jgi:hypothetical protein
MKTLRMRWWSVLAVAVALTAAAFALGHASTRNYLTVEGKVYDHLGSPMPGTWVFCLGSRRASVMVDTSGTYRLEIPGATLEELERGPLRIRVQARRKGFRFALSNGAPELGLELRVVKDEDLPLARLRVMSNDSATVATVANSVVLDASPRALLSATFVGSPGAPYDSPPVPLDLADEITLAGKSQSIPELAARDSVSREPGTGPASSASTSPPAPPGTAGLAPKSAASGSSAPNPAPPAGSAAVEPLAATPTAPGSLSTSAAVPGTKPTPTTESAPAPPRKWNAAGSGRGGNSKPRVVRPGLDPSAATGPPRSSAPAAGPQHPSAPASETPPSPPPASDPRTSAPTAEAARRSAPASAPGTSAGTEAPRKTPSASDAPRISPPSPEPRRKSSHDAKKVAAPPPSAMDVTRSDRSAQRVDTSTDQELVPVLQRQLPIERVRVGEPPPARQVPSVPDKPTSTPKRPSSSAGPMCDCTIRGTVEVQWDRPLSSRTEVVIAVEDAPDITTSAELFMGSPRAFEIHSAPCGVHRLLLWTRSKQRFVMVSTEPRVVCTPRSMQQMRLVLEPVARWGASK